MEIKNKVDLLEKTSKTTFPLVGHGLRHEKHQLWNEWLVFHNENFHNENLIILVFNQHQAVFKLSLPHVFYIDCERTWVYYSTYYFTNYTIKQIGWPCKGVLTDFNPILQQILTTQYPDFLWKWKQWE